MEAKHTHTPGPWRAVGSNIFADTGRLYQRPIAVVGVPLDKNDNRVGELEANARLIAAAPDMLEALMACVEPTEPGEDCPLPPALYNMVCAAIAKATA